MADANSTPARPAVRSLPAPHVHVSYVIEMMDAWDNVVISFMGTAQQLVAASAATPVLIARGKPGKPRLDCDGDRAFVQHRKGWMRVRRHKSVERALTLPGVTFAQIAEEHAAWKAHAEAFGRQERELPRRPYLRLVVDNTRE
jgi:hypothetical protein